MPANANNTMATVPEITPKKYNAATTTASNILITRSAIPIFFFILLVFYRDLIE